jgi:MFS transporter, YNFM family, putative membrane transport protein
MAVASRNIAVSIAGFCTFLNLYSPQALLPMLSREFGVGAADISTIMTASTLAIALTAPFTGAVADVLGRKRVITAAMPMIGVAFASDVQALIVWRFIQGLLLPPIFAVTVAYIGDEWPPAQVAGIAGVYIAGSSLGGFSGRFVPGVLGDLFGWRAAFLALAALSFLGAIMVGLLLPREKRFVRSNGLSASARQMLRHLKDPQLLATYAIGFGVLFNFIAVFTYVSFHLAAPPYRFSSTLLGLIFVTYLAGTMIAPMTGWVMAGLGRRRFLLAVIAAWAGGALLTLLTPIAAIIAGLTFCAGCGMLARRSQPAT